MNSQVSETVHILFNFSESAPILSDAQTSKLLEFFLLLCTNYVMNLFMWLQVSLSTWSFGQFCLYLFIFLFWFYYCWLQIFGMFIYLCLPLSFVVLSFII